MPEKYIQVIETINDVVRQYNKIDEALVNIVVSISKRVDFNDTERKFMQEYNTSRKSLIYYAEKYQLLIKDL